MMRVEYRLTRPEDLMRFGLVLADGARAVGWTGWVGRRAIGLGGVLIDAEGRAWGHFAVTPDYRDRVLRGLHRRTLRLLRHLRRAGVREIRAVCDLQIPRAAEWMKRLGFTMTDDAVDGSPVHVRTV